MYTTYPNLTELQVTLTSNAPNTEQSNLLLPALAASQRYRLVRWTVAANQTLLHANLRVMLRDSGGTDHSEIVVSPEVPIFSVFFSEPGHPINNALSLSVVSVTPMPRQRFRAFIWYFIDAVT